MLAWMLLLCAADKPVVVILPFASPADHRELGESAVESFTTQLVEGKSVRVMERGKLDKVLKEHELNMSGFVDASTVKRQLGKFVSAHYVVMGRIGESGDGYALSARLVNIESSEVEVAKEIAFRDVASLRVAVKSLARQFVGDITGVAPAASRTDALLGTNAKSFYDAADALVSELARLHVDVVGEVGEVDTSGKHVVVESKQGFAEVPLGTKLEVFHDGASGKRKVGELYVSEPGGQSLGASYLKGTKGAQLEMGDEASSRGYKARVAMAAVVDESADDEAMVKKFRQSVIDRLADNEWMGSVSYEEVEELLGERPQFKELWKRGVDYVVVGKFYGKPGDRRTDFRVYNAYTGKTVTQIKYDTTL
jgi:TolB-like protein